MQKVLIIGNSGSGKTTLAHTLSEKLNLPIIHLDQYFWNPGWRPTEKQLWEKKVKELVERSRWIMDGNYSSTFDIRFQSADTIIFLDFPIRITFYRVLMRTLLNHGEVRPDLADDCPERFNLPFFKYVLSFNRYFRPRIIRAIEDYGQSRIYHFHHPEQVENFVKQLAL